MYFFRVLVKSSSGYGSFDESNIGSNCFEESKPLKRAPDVHICHKSGKKNKLNESNAENAEYNCLESNLSIFETSLDAFNITQILENSDHSHEKIKAIDVVKGPEESENNPDLPSQFFNTQVINQLDNVATNTLNNNMNVSTFNKSEGKMDLPLLHSFEERLKSRSVNKPLLDEEIKDRSVLFEDEKITTRYKQEVDSVFDELEQTVFTMGVAKSQTIHDDVLNAIFNTNYQQSLKDSKYVEEIEKVTLKEASDSNLNKSTFNKSFCSILKEAIKKSGNKPKENLSNLSFNERNREFCCLGPFYGLPFKVKELINQYKGIEELYGE